MKKFFYTFVFVAITILFVGCNKAKVYQQRHEFEDYTWERLTNNKTITFTDINIEDTSAVYDIYVSIRHTPYINENKLKFLMKITTPDGISRESNHNINLKDRYTDKWVGDAAGDLIDVEEKCRSFVSFTTKGKYNISLTNLGTQFKTTGIIDMGIKIVKSDLDNYNGSK